MTSSSAPWRRVLDDIAAGITDGRWPVGAEIPSYTTLSKTYGVSVHTVRRAIRELRDQGVLRGEQGVSVTVVREPMPPSQTSLEERCAALEDQAQQMQRRQDLQEAVLRDLFARLGQQYPMTDDQQQPERRQASGG